MWLLTLEAKYDTIGQLSNTFQIQILVGQEADMKNPWLIPVYVLTPFVLLFGYLSLTTSAVPAVVEKQTHLKCFLHGEVVVDTTTLHGASRDNTFDGKGDFWAWEEDSGVKTYPGDKSVSCTQEGLSYSNVQKPSQPLVPSIFVCKQDGIEVLRAKTVDGATYQRVRMDPSNQQILNVSAYGWYEADGPHYVTVDTVKIGVPGGDKMDCVDTSIE